MQINISARHGDLSAATQEKITDKVGKLTRSQIKEIAQAKMEDLNAVDMEGAVKIIKGSARSMGIEVEG